MTGEPICKFCSKTLDPYSPQVYRLVAGWEKNRGTGQGVHPIKSREVLGELAHSLCLDAAIRGGSQQAML